MNIIESGASLKLLSLSDSPNMPLSILSEEIIRQEIDRKREKVEKMKRAIEDLKKTLEEEAEMAKIDKSMTGSSGNEAASRKRSKESCEPLLYY